MKYQEIYNEYTSLINNYSKIRFELQSLPKGSIVKKNIANKEYHYLQYTSYGKKKTEYIREPEVEGIQSKLIRSDELKEKIRDIYGFTVYDCNGKEIKRFRNLYHWRSGEYRTFCVEKTFGETRRNYMALCQWQECRNGDTGTGRK